MIGPQNNLDDIRRKASSRPTVASPPVGIPSSSQSKPSKFKPAARPVNTPDHAKQRSAALSSFSTSGFVKSKTAPLKPVQVVEKDSPAHISISSTESLSFTSPELPIKRTSSDSSADLEPAASPKRPRVEKASNKENVFSADVKGKGKARELDSLGPLFKPTATDFRTPSKSYRTQNAGECVAATSSAAEHPRTMPVDWSDLLAQSDSDLLSVLSCNLDLRSQVSEWLSECVAGKASGHDPVLLRHIDKLLQDRISAINAVRASRKRQEQPALPVPKWILDSTASSPAPNGIAPSSMPNLQPYSSSASPDVRAPATSSDTFLSSRPVTEYKHPTAQGKDVPPTALDKDTFGTALDSDDLLWQNLEEASVIDQFRLPSPEASLPTPRSPPPPSECLVTTIQTRTSTIVDTKLTETPWYPEVRKKLSDVFKVESFRRNQLEAINATLDGQDVFVLMPTGGGKSLCFQLPAICETGRTKGVTVVIGPLISLMDDQVQALREKGIDVEAIHKDMSSEKSREIRYRLRQSPDKPKLLYVTPERIQLDGMNETLGVLYRQNLLARFAVDEVHCISEWGRDFRDAYKALDVLRKNFPKVPIMALTGTATKRVVNDIITRLRIEECVQLRQSFNRPNLNYMVESKVGRGLAKIVEFINSRHPGKTGIIYCRSRADCEQVAGELCDQYHIPAEFFHARLERDTKTQILQDWQSGACKVVVATTAFGMGIDKADVRFVIHQCLPRSLEGYYQETGRAGRDGKPADCVLYYSYGDAQSLFRLIRNEETTSPESKEASEDGLRRVVQFCQNTTDCRREQVLAYFDEKFDARNCNQRCDNCRNGGAILVQDVTDVAKMILSRMPDDEYRITRNQLVDIVRGSQKKDLREKGFDQLSLFGACKDKGENVERIVDLMLAEQHLATRSVQCHQSWTKEYLKLGPGAAEFLRGGKQLLLKYRDAEVQKKAPRGRKRAAPSGAASLDTSASTSRAPSRATKRKGPSPFIDDDPIELFVDDTPDQIEIDDDIIEMPSPRKPATRSTRPKHSASTSTLICADIEILEGEPDVTKYRQLQRLCREIAAEQRVTPDDILPDGALQSMSLKVPQDLRTLKQDLIDLGLEMTPAVEAVLPRFFKLCIKQLMSDPQAAGSTSKKPPSMADLHSRYGYNDQTASAPYGRAKPLSRSRTKA